jgi:hypothetical protein
VHLPEPATLYCDAATIKAHINKLFGLGTLDSTLNPSGWPGSKSIVFVSMTAGFPSLPRTIGGEALPRGSVLLGWFRCGDDENFLMFPLSNLLSHGSFSTSFVAVTNTKSAFRERLKKKRNVPMQPMMSGPLAS